jgi:type IV secretion system protein VirB9
MIRWLALMLACTAPAAAQVRPAPGNGDPRLQTIIYDPDQVVQLLVAQGYQLMVSFAPGERIETIAVGDSTAWQVTANKRGEHLFVKAIQPGNATNLTVVTDARVYAFELIGGYGGADMAYAVRFVYAHEAASPPVKVVAQHGYRYRLSGARAIKPQSVLVDGATTIVEWPDNASLPAIFKVDDDGDETLVNSEVKDGRFVIEGTPRKLVFRLDRLTAVALRQRVRASRP